MSAETQAIAQRFYTVYNEKKPELLNELLAETYIGHINGHDIVGGESAKKFITDFLNGFPDAHYTINDLIDSGGDKLVSRWTCTGTHKGTFFGIEPTNKKVTTTGITIFQIHNHQIIQIWNNWDVFGLMNQIKN
jgi:steroid delta-isomerase-like uncharacterized protein